MKIISLIIISLFLLPIVGSCEEHNNVPDQLGSIFDGSGNTYIGAEVIKDNIIGNWGLKGWADVMVGSIDDDVHRDVRGGLRVRLVL